MKLEPIQFHNFHLNSCEKDDYMFDEPAGIVPLEGGALALRPKVQLPCLSVQTHLAVSKQYEMVRGPYFTFSFVSLKEK